MTKLDDLALHMITYYAADPARIQHFIKVHSFAALIARQEGMDTATLEILEAAAMCMISESNRQSRPMAVPQADIRKSSAPPRPAP